LMGQLSHTKKGHTRTFFKFALLSKKHYTIFISFRRYYL
jgi:hypothetical protein